MTSFELVFLALLSALNFVHAHDARDQIPMNGDALFDAAVDISQEPWTSKYGPQSDLGFTGPLSFSHLEYRRCLEDASQPFDIGIIGFPFDTKTSYRPGGHQIVLSFVCIFP